MSKKLWCSLAIVLIIIVAIVLFVVLRSPGDTKSIAFTNNGKALDSISTQKALQLPKTETCLTNRPAVKIVAEKQSGLSEETGVWTDEIYNVPAGTNVQVNVSTYGNGTVTGSLMYPSKYGSYNFKLTKQTSGWYFTRFTGCRP